MEYTEAEEYSKDYRMPYNLKLFSITNILQNYGWYILLAIIFFAYAYEKWLKFILGELKQKREEAEYAAKYHKNPDLLQSRLRAQEKRIQQLQEEYEKSVEEHERKMKEKRAAQVDSKPLKSLRTEYNPLMGHGGGSNYRPQRKSACSKGGCG